MQHITEEKILYHALHSGSFTIQSYEYDGGHLSKCLDNLIKYKFITWETNNLWRDYKQSGSEDYYDSAFHQYKITETGEVRLAIYRLTYAHKNHRDQDKHLRRMDQLTQLLENYSLDIDNFKNNCTKNEVKAINYYKDSLDQSKKIEEAKAVGEALKQVIRPKLISETELPQLVQKLKNVQFGTCAREEEDNSKNSHLNDIDFSEPVLNNMFQMSTALGDKGFDSSRTWDYVLRKVNEELGEMTLEMNIADGLSYKEAGKDGVKGEAVDLAICAMDMFALECQGMSAEEIEREFLTYMCTKLHKWRKSIQ